MHIFEENIKQLGIDIPDMPSPLANYVPFKVSDNIVYVSGQGPVKNGELIYKGKVVEDITVEEGIKAAELCCINIIAALKKTINGDWNRLDSFLKLGGFVNCNSNFYDQPKVINGASDLIDKVFEKKGEHTRAAISANSLPLGVAVEVDAVFEVN